MNALETNGTDSAESTNGTATEDEAYLKSLEDDLNDEDPVGGNAQQALQKATFAILRCCDTLLCTKTNVNKETLSHSIDAISLIGHAVGESTSFPGSFE